MKLKIYLLLLVALPSGAWAIDTIPNAGFENWVFSGWFLNPQGWQTNNNQLMPNTVVQDSDSYSGQLAMKLINSGSLIPEAWCGFTLSQHPLAMMGYYKIHTSSGDSGAIRVHIFYQGSLVDSGYMPLFSGINPFYFLINLGISQSSSFADSCSVFLTGGTQNLGAISVDDLSFSFPSSVTGEASASFEIGPNPANEYTRIKNPGFEPGDRIELCDVTGKIIREIKIAAIETQIELNDLAAGAYICSYISKSGNTSRMIIRE